MASKKIEDALEEAINAFEEYPDEREIETGLKTGDAMELQLRKSCRLLKASEELLEENGYYILVIDACFTAIERTLQAYLLEKNVLKEGETVFDHEKIYRMARNTGIYDKDFEEDLKMLWKENRSKNYYRDGIPSETRAEKMYKLAKSVHKHVVGMSSEGYVCMCGFGI